MLKLYHKYLEKRKLEELKMQVRLAGGTVPEDEEDLETAKARAEEKLHNPMKDFPNDINYLSLDACKRKVEISAKFEGKIEKDKIWDMPRMNACLGKYGIVAKRCSMNDILWDRYLQHGDALTIDEIKKMILFDAKRRELYPQDYNGTGEEQPPQEYLDKLKAEGKLDAIYKELDRIGNG